MKAAFFHGYGGLDVLEYGDLPDPVAGEGQVLVKLSAASVAPLDWKLRAGMLAQFFTPPFPKIPGRDGTGTVIACGAGVTGFAAGDRVCVMAPANNAAGTYAEMIACDQSHVLALPDMLSMQGGASLINSGLSAWICAVRTANVQPGQKVLVHSGAGAVGGLLVQLCRHLGASVTATCRSTNKDYVTSLGAAEAIAYDGEDFTTIEPQDIVFDLMGGDVHDRSYEVVKPGGHLVWVNALPIVDRGAEFGIRVSRAAIADDRDAVASIMDLAARDILKPQVAQTLPLSEAREAQRLMQDGAISRGRLILEI